METREGIACQKNGLVDGKKSRWGLNFRRKINTVLWRLSTNSASGPNVHANSVANDDVDTNNDAGASNDADTSDDADSDNRPE